MCVCVFFVVVLIGGEGNRDTYTYSYPTCCFVWVSVLECFADAVHVKFRFITIPFKLPPWACIPTEEL